MGYPVKVVANLQQRFPVAYQPEAFSEAQQLFGHIQSVAGIQGGCVPRRQLGATLRPCVIIK